MLNRIKKNLIITMLTGTLCLTLPSFAIDSTISFININNLAYQDVEIVITDSNEILVPFKQLADIFEIQYEGNRIDKQISFKTFDGKEGMITLMGVFVEDVPLTKQKPIFINQGIIDGVFNEAYIPSNVVAQIMNIKLETNFEMLALNAQVERDIPILVHAYKGFEDENTPKAYQDIVAPKKKGKITLNTIGLRSSLTNDNSTIKYQEYSDNSDIFTGTTELSINGDLNNGKYKISATEFHYRSDAFMFGGLSGTYRNKFTSKKNDKTYHYELGKIKGILDEDSQIATNVFGAQIWNYDNEKVEPSRISGYVKPSSLVRLTVNDLEPVTLNTYAGYYSLKDVQLPNPVLKIKLEEINEDGTVELITEERYSKFDRKTPIENEARTTAFAGVWGYQNRFFREGQNIYRGNNKKFTVGAEYQYGLKDNVTFKSKLTADNIYEKNNADIVFQAPTHDTLLVSGTKKSTNYLEGATSLNSIEWKNEKNKNIKARAIGGVSVARDIRDEDTHFGYSGRLVGEYEKKTDKVIKNIFKPKHFKVKAEVFQNSPDFYIASSDSTSKNDRTGGKISTAFGFNSTNVGGNYSRYFSNLNHRYEGGTLTFDEAGINANTKIPKIASLRYNSYYRHGKNDLGRNINYNYDASVMRVFGPGIVVQGGRRDNYYDTRYYEQTLANNSYNSKYSDIYTQVDVPIPGNYGKYSMGHSFVRYDSGNYKNGYNMFRFGYTFPAWKRITLGLGWGFRYHGQGGNDLNANISYRAKSGQSMTVGYQYSKNGGYFIDNLFMPTTSRHTVNFTFNDAFQIFNHGLKSVGDEDLNKGLFEAIAYIDVNKNGKYDKKVDIPMKDIPLITSWAGENNITNKRGKVYASSIEEGVYTVGLDMDNLPIVVAPLTNDEVQKRIKIGGGQTTKVEIPLVSTVGSVSGVLKISDDFDRGLRISDFVVVLLDENGDEVNYSTVDSSGEFYISGLAPGKYTLQLDERFVSAYGLEETPTSSLSIMIPYDYKNPTDLIDQNLEYRAIAL